MEPTGDGGHQPQLAMEQGTRDDTNISSMESECLQLETGATGLFQRFSDRYRFHV
jgi:hypothetical protein